MPLNKFRFSKRTIYDPIELSSVDVRNLLFEILFVNTVLMSLSSEKNTNHDWNSYSKVDFLGFEIDATGHQMDPERLKPLVGMKSPRDQSHLRSILRCLQYHSRFTLNFATKSQTMPSAQSSDEWRWTDECDRILCRLIIDIGDRPKLTPFVPKKSTVLATDASEVRIGAVLGQEGSPVSHISRLLNSAERGHSQTQKEALTSFWLVRRPHNYLYGLGFTITTDQKAL